ncbi:hypothetical protein NL303_26465, partial [Klebsiella pneumoniae]|nr:hypothetical protein [Klebsiella pneumoniae]
GCAVAAFPRQGFNVFLAQHLLVGLLWCAASSRVQEFGIRFGGTVRWFSALTAYLRGPAFAIMPTPRRGNLLAPLQLC